MRDINPGAYDVVAVAQEAINSRKVGWGDGNLILGIPKLTKMSEDMELVVAATDKNLLPYHVTYFSQFEVL